MAMELSFSQQNSSRWNSESPDLSHEILPHVPIVFHHPPSHRMKTTAQALRRVRSWAEGILVPKWLQGQFPTLSILVNKKQICTLLTLWIRSELVEHPMSNWNDTELEISTKEPLSICQVILCTRISTVNYYLCEVKITVCMVMKQ